MEMMDYPLIVLKTKEEASQLNINDNQWSSNTTTKTSYNSTIRLLSMNKQRRKLNNGKRRSKI
jgi:hypothetical protein